MTWLKKVQKFGTKFCVSASLENSSSFFKKKGRIDLLGARRGQVPKNRRGLCQ